MGCHKTRWSSRECDAKMKTLIILLYRCYRFCNERTVRFSRNNMEWVFTLCRFR